MESVLDPPMIEQISLLLAAPIVKAILDKFYEGVGSKLGEKAVEMLPEKAKHLGQLIWEKCLRGKPGTEQLLQSAANGSADDQRKLAEYLHKVLDANADLRQEAQKIAEEIHVEITHDSSSQIINVNDNAKAWVTKVTGGTAYIGEIHITQPPST